MNTGQNEARNFKTSTVFVQSQNFMRTLAAVGDIQGIAGFGNQPSYKFCGPLQFLTWKSLGNFSVCDIVKTADRSMRRVKRLEIWVSQS